MDIDQISDIATIHSGTEDQHDHIPIKDGIVNIYKTQIIIVEKKQKESQIVNKKKTNIHRSERHKFRKCYNRYTSTLHT